MKQPAYYPFRSEEARNEYVALYTRRAKPWPVSSETRFIESASGQTFVRISGRMSDPPLVLLPGSRGTSLTWMPNISALCGRYRAYALDSIYDFGLSVRHRKLTKPNEIIKWLDEVLSILVPQGTLRLMGLSYGGWLSGQYALHFPARVHKLVMLSPAMTILPASNKMIMRALLTILPSMRFRRQFYYWLLQDAVQSGAAGRAFVDEAIADWAVAERCFKSLPLVAATVLDDKTLQQFRTPCLFLVGENEKIYSAQKAVSRIQRIAPQIRTEIIPHAGHDAWYVQSKMINDKVLEFLK